jgi:hypothetical protein
LIKSRTAAAPKPFTYRLTINLAISKTALRLKKLNHHPGDMRLKIFLSILLLLVLKFSKAQEPVLLDTSMFNNYWQVINLGGLDGGFINKVTILHGQGRKLMLGLEKI